MGFQYEFDEDKKGIKVSLGRLFDFPLEDSEYVMSNIMDVLLEIRGATTLSLVGTREYAYDTNQTRLLVETAFAYEQLLEWQRSLKWEGVCQQCQPQRTQDLQTITAGMIKRDPIGAYVKAKRLARKLGISGDINHTECNTTFINNMLLKVMQILGGTQLLQTAASYIAGYQIGDRSVYRKIFHPSMRPNFMLTRYLTLPPEKAELLDRYEINRMQVEIFKVPGKMRNVYHVTPAEFRLDEKQYNILDSARRYLAEHKPKEEEFANLDRMREIFFNIGKDIIRDISRGMGIELSQDEEEGLAKILTRYTAGLGVLEILLADEKIQDVFINSPIGAQPVFIYHSDFEECETNIIPTSEDAEVWATRFRIISGRPLDEANPVLDTEINVPGGRARVSVITRSLSPEGLGYALRRHRDEPWTYPLLIKSKAMNPLAAGLMWFLVDGARTILIAGTRGAGKTSFLGATMSEIMKRYRVISLEDTLELPVEFLRSIGYNIERLKSRSVITKLETELPADEALRAALRLGDSALIVGEVRSVEAKALYEAMRVGALANVVAGTIHGDSPYGVYDRIVNDLGVPPTSFKATDVIAIANRLRSSDGTKTFRRMTEITEVRKHWKSDPADEGGFVPLMEYSAKEDTLKPTQALLAGESFVLNDIARRVRDWSGNWEAVWDNILLRAKIKEALVVYAEKLEMPQLLEARFSTVANDQFYGISESVKRELGGLDSNEIFLRWNDWLKNEVKTLKMVRV
jgi:archaeal flagellar protein FlaI